MIIATRGIGGNHAQVRKNWLTRLGAPPATMITGVPAYVDGRMLDIAEASGVRLVNEDRMWHSPRASATGIRSGRTMGSVSCPDPRPMWFDTLGRRLPAPGLPGYNTLGTLKTAAHHAGHCRVRPFLVHRDPQDYRAGVRPVGVGAEPRHHHRDYKAAAEEPARQGTAPPVKAFMDRVPISWSPAIFANWWPVCTASPVSSCWTNSRFRCRSGSSTLKPRTRSAKAPS
jgi:uncharacterized protein